MTLSRPGNLDARPLFDPEEPEMDYPPASTCKRVGLPNGILRAVKVIEQERSWYVCGCRTNGPPLRP